MQCETCAIEETYRKRANRILRTVNGILRRRESNLKQHADQVFVALCDTESAAEIALGELWGSGEFDCGPQDYDYMVEQSIEAMRRHKAENTARTQPIIERVSQDGGLPSGF